jgi:hypothetical protein
VAHDRVSGTNKDQLMNLLSLFGVLSLIVTAINYAIYIPSILRGETKPHIFSWIIFSLFTAAVFWVQAASGSGPGSWATGATALACTAITILSIKYGTKDITRSDVFMFVLAIAGFASWAIMTDPFFALCCVLVAETAGFIPTFRKSYIRPYEEPLSAYILSALKMLLSLAAVETYNFYTLAYPVLFVVLYISFTVMVLIRQSVPEVRQNPVDN